MAAPKSILILGGTGEARQLAGALARKGVDITSALAGRTSTPLMPSGKVRIGGFGGPEGLASFLRAGGFTHLVDATHPFAARISASAVTASASTGIPLVRLERPAWTRPCGATWKEVDTLTGAAAALPAGARVLLTTGRQEIGAFFHRTDCRFVARVIERPQTPPQDWTVVTARGPFSVTDEETLMAAHSITHLVSKNSGGTQTAAKLEAAAKLDVTVVMVRRPVLPDAAIVTSVAEAVAWCAALLENGAHADSER